MGVVGVEPEDTAVGDGGSGELEVVGLLAINY